MSVGFPSPSEASHLLSPLPEEQLETPPQTPIPSSPMQTSLGVAVKVASLVKLGDYDQAYEVLKKRKILSANLEEDRHEQCALYEIMANIIAKQGGIRRALAFVDTLPSEAKKLDARFTQQWQTQQALDGMRCEIVWEDLLRRGRHVGTQDVERVEQLVASLPLSSWGKCRACADILHYLIDNQQVELAYRLVKKWRGGSEWDNATSTEDLEIFRFKVFCNTVRVMFEDEWQPLRGAKQSGATPANGLQKSDH